MDTQVDPSVQAAVERLSGVDEDDLYRLLGLRVRAMERNPAIAGAFDPEIGAADQAAFTVGDLQAFGRETFQRISRPGFELLCGGAASGGALDRLLGVLNTSPTTVAAALATLLVGQLGIAPAIAGIAATIVVGRVAPKSLDALCGAWQKRIVPA